MGLRSFINSYRLDYGETFLSRWWVFLVCVATFLVCMVWIGAKLYENSRAVESCGQLDSVAVRTVDGELICIRGRTAPP